jgi:hypothetical protein
MRILLDVSGDDDGNVWMDAADPVELLSENEPPYRIAIRSLARQASSDKGGSPIWLRLGRPQAHRLIDLLGNHLASADAHHAEKVVANTMLKAPLNGGVNSATGNMVFLFEGASGLQHRFELPFDESGALLEIVERAASAGAEWADQRLTHEPGTIEAVDLKPREVDSMLLGQEPNTGQSILSVRLRGGHQFSFLLDRKIVEQIRVRHPRLRSPPIQNIVPYIGVAGAIEWFRDEWCVIHEPPTDDELLRGSAMLRSLLVEDVIGRAWRAASMVSLSCRPQT